MQWLLDYFQKVRSMFSVSKQFSCDQTMCHSDKVNGEFRVQLDISDSTFV